MALKKLQEPTRLDLRKQKLRKLLNTPIRLKNVPAADRNAFIVREQERRFSAALELYDISPETPELARWIALASYVMAERFKGLRALDRQPGGAPRVPDGEYVKLVAEWRKFLTTAKRGSDIARARWFLDQHADKKIKLAHETITHPSSLLKAIARSEKITKKAAL